MFADLMTAAHGLARMGRFWLTGQAEAYVVAKCKLRLDMRHRYGCDRCARPWTTAGPKWTMFLPSACLLCPECAEGPC